MTNLKEEPSKDKKKVTKNRDEINELKESLKESKLRTRVMKKIIEKLTKDKDKTD